MIGVKVHNANTVKTELRHTGERVVNYARQAMRLSAGRIEEEGKINAPRALQALEDAIFVEADYGWRGRLILTIDIMDSIYGIDVAQYAIEVHENYEDFATSEDEEARLRTKEKQAQYPDHYIGGKFLERAADKEKYYLEKYLVAAVTSAIKG